MKGKRIGISILNKDKKMKTMNGQSGHQFENRFKSYGIVKDANELEDFVRNAQNTAELFFNEEKPLF